jgi:hypothetical protein
MSVGLLPAMPVPALRRGAFKARGDLILGRLQTFITALTAMIAVLVVAAASVALAIS